MNDELRDRRIQKQGEAERTEIRRHVGAAMASADVRAQVRLARQLQVEAMTIAAGEEQIREILPAAALERLAAHFAQSRKTSQLQRDAAAALYESAGVAPLRIAR